MTCGVSTTITSRLSFFLLDLLNKLPTYGILERNGTPELLLFFSEEIRPPTMNGVLSATRTKVCTCRLSTTGASSTLLPFLCSPLLEEFTELTIVSICIVTSEPSSLMRGRRFSTIPVCR